jgi:dTDP-4-dehydrorhamnose 3,5-epimerase
MGVGMNVIATDIEGVLIIEPQVFQDRRGCFLETYHDNRFKAAGLSMAFVQDNLSFSVKGTLRGMHFQVNHPQAKLVQAITGEIFDVAVDIRPGSSTFGRWMGVHLSEQNRRQVLLTPGFAHGFCVLSETAYVAYKCSQYYMPDDESGILWSDPSVGIDWPVKDPIISHKDSRLPCLSELPPEKLYHPEKAS